MEQDREQKDRIEYDTIIQKRVRILQRELSDLTMLISGHKPGYIPTEMSDYIERVLCNIKYNVDVCMRYNRKRIQNNKGKTNEHYKRIS